MARVVADEHLVDFQNRAQFTVEGFRRNVRQIKIDLILAAYPLAFQTDLENFSRGNVARDQIAVGRVLVFEKIPAFFFGDG